MTINVVVSSAVREALNQPATTEVVVGAAVREALTKPAVTKVVVGRLAVETLLQTGTQGSVAMTLAQFSQLLLTPTVPGPTAVLNF